MCEGSAYCNDRSDIILKFGGPLAPAGTDTWTLSDNRGLIIGETRSDSAPFAPLLVEFQRSGVGRYNG
jgi:hypothetical protein